MGSWLQENEGITELIAKYEKKGAKQNITWHTGLRLVTSHQPTMHTGIPETREQIVC